MIDLQKRNILVIRLSALGDVAMTIPAIYSVARAYPQHTFRVLTSSLCSQLFVNAPHNINVIALSAGESHGFMGILRLLQRIKETPVDAVADLHNVLRSWLIDILYLLRFTPVAILDKRRGERKLILYKHFVTKYPYTNRYFDVFSRLEMPCEPHFTSLFTDTLPNIPKGFLKQPNTTWIGIAPFARYKNKIYPIDMMKQVVMELALHPHTEVFLFGSRGEEAKRLAMWEDASPHLHSIAGKLPLQQELILMAHLDLMLTMDSANMHLASLVGLRAISIWGGTTPACGFFGWQQTLVDSFVANCACQPCTIAGRNHCRYSDFHCLTAITPIEVVSKIISTLQTDIEIKNEK